MGMISFDPIKGAYTIENGIVRYYNDAYNPKPQAAPAQQSAQLAQNQAQELRATTLASAERADPFASQRPQYQGQLSRLMQNPGEFAASPMFQFAMDQGMDAVNRTAAAKGELGAGKRLTDLMKFGQGLAGQQYFPQAQLLANLAGANAGSPVSASQMSVAGLQGAQNLESQAKAEQLYAGSRPGATTNTKLVWR